MNESFSKSLNDALILTTDKLIAQVKADTLVALEANNDTITNIVESMKTASAGVTTMVEDFNKNLHTTYKKSKAVLDGRVKAYHTAMAYLFKVDGWRQVFFWLGILASISTPIFLALNLIFGF